MSTSNAASQYRAGNSATRSGAYGTGTRALSQGLCNAISVATSGKLNVVLGEKGLAERVVNLL